MRSRSRGFYQSRRSNFQKAVPVILIFAFVSAVVLFIVIKSSGTMVPDGNTNAVADAWNRQDYREVVELSSAELLEKTLEPTLLLYHGIANFYYGITLVNHDERQSRFNAALHSLRKLLYEPPVAYRSELWYILGKTYFHKGSFYYDLSDKNLSLADEAGLRANDILEYLGVIHLDFQKYQEAIAYLTRAIEREPRDVLFYTVAEAYENMERLDDAFMFYSKALEMSRDSFLNQEAKIGQGRIFFFKGAHEDAEHIFSEVIDENEQAAEAYFYLGEIYFNRGDLVKARANWRESYNQDRTFTAALERLQM